MEFIENRRVRYSTLMIKLGPDSKKDPKTLYQISGINDMTFEDCQTENKQRIKKFGYNQYWLLMQDLKDIIIFDTDNEKSYESLKTYLESENLYDKYFVTKSFSGRELDLSYKRHFWFKIDPQSFEDIKKQKYSVKDGIDNDIFIGGGVVGEFNDLEMEFHNLPLMSREIFNTAALLLKQSINIIKLIANNDGEIAQPIKKIIKNIPINDSDTPKSDIETNDEFIMIKDLLNMLTPKYYDNHSEWLKIMMFLRKYEKNTGLNMFELLNDFSKKSKKYDYEVIKKNYYGYLSTYDINCNIGTLIHFAKESNLSLALEIIHKRHDNNIISITEKYLADKIKELAGDIFFYKNGKLYCFDTKNKFWYEDRKELLLRFISDELKDHVKHLITDAIKSEKYLIEQMKILNDLCGKYVNIIKIVETFHFRYFNERIDDIEFDQKYHLIGFNNGVFDLKKNEFRDYKYDDYMTTKTGYNYKKPTDEELKRVCEILDTIETEKDKQYLLLQILSTGLIGKKTQKFILFNGAGGNGKSSISIFMRLTLGEYFYKGNINTLCEEIKSGANPEIANMNKKRYIVFTEPKSTKKIQNNTIKSWTGDATLNNRVCHSNNTVVNLMGTIVLECNQRITLQEEATDADRRRLIDYPYLSKFVEDDALVDKDKRIFKGDKRLEDDEYIGQYKYAFFQILADMAQKYLTVDIETLKIPEEITRRTEEYLGSSYILLTLLRENTEKTNDKKDILKIQDLFNAVKFSDAYTHLSKDERRKITKKYMIDFYRTNSFTKKDYVEDYRYYNNNKEQIRSRNILLGYKMLSEIDDVDEVCVSSKKVSELDE